MMQMEFLVSLSLAALFGSHYVMGMSGSCYNKCVVKTTAMLNEEKTTTVVNDLVDACSFGCRMAELDKLLSWPFPSNSTECRKSCISGYSRLEEMRSCFIGCNTTIDRTLPSLSSDSQTLDSSILNYFSPSFSSFTVSSSSSWTFISLSSDQSQGEEGVDATANEEQQQPNSAVQFIYVFMYGDQPGSSKIYSSESSDIISDEYSRQSFSYSNHCVWTVLQFLCFVMILVSFILCFCTFFTNEPEKEEEPKHCPKEEKTYKLQPFAYPISAYTVPVTLDGKKKPLP